MTNCIAQLAAELLKLLLASEAETTSMRRAAIKTATPMVVLLVSGNYSGMHGWN
jgi:hypothetical protein